MKRQQAPKAGGCASWTNAFYRKVLKMCKVVQMCKIAQNVQNCETLCKIVQNLQTCAKSSKLCKICKIMHNCAKSAKLCKMCTIVQMYNMCKTVQNV